MDYAVADIGDQLELFFSFQCYLNSTHKHTPEKPRLRLIIPLSHEISPDEYMAVSRKVAEEIGMELFDDTTYEPSRLMYWPSTSSDGEFIFQEIKGELLKPEDVLALYTDWKDVSSWPVSIRQRIIVQKSLKKQENPLEKRGIIGAFNRTFTIQQAIDAFIPDVYQPSEMAGRYDYIPADSSAGVVIYDDVFAYSHHATDPACGKLMNAFDVVRIHKFGNLDEKVTEEIPGASVANYNCPGQIVITGKTAAVEKAAESLKAAGAKRAVLLNVSGPFHSKMLESAGEELAKEMEKRNFEPLAIPYVTNVTAKYVTDIKETKALLAKQISSPVRWEESVRTMIEDGVDTFVEIGPGKTLAGFMRRIDKGVKVYNIETWEDMEKVIAELV